MALTEEKSRETTATNLLFRKKINVCKDFACLGLLKLASHLKFAKRSLQT